MSLRFYSLIVLSIFLSPILFSNPASVPLKIEELGIPYDRMSSEMRKKMDSTLKQTRSIPPFWREKLKNSQTPAQRIENQKELLSALLLNAKIAYWVELYEESISNLEEAAALCRENAWAEQADIIALGYLNKVRKKAEKMIHISRYLDSVFKKKSKLPVVDYTSFSKVQPFEFFVQDFHSLPVRAIAVDPTGSFLLSGGDDRTILVYDLKTYAVIKKIYTEGPVKNIVFDPMGQFICWLESKNLDKPESREKLKIWNLKTNQVNVKEEKNLYVDKMAIDPKGKYLYTAGFLVRVFKLDSGEEIKKINFSKSFYSIAVDPMGEYLLLGFFQGIDYLNLRDFKLKKTLKMKNETVGVLGVSPDRKFVLSAGGTHEKYGENGIQVWEFKTGQLLKTLYGHKNAISGLALTPGGETLISSSWDQSVKFWNLKEGTALKSMKVHYGSIANMILEPKENRIITCDSMNVIKVWDHRGQVAGELSSQPFAKVHLPMLSSFAFAPANRVLLGYTDGKIHIWDLSLAGVVNSYPIHQRGASKIEVDPVSGNVFSLDGELKIWDISTGEVKKTIQPGNDFAGMVALNRKGQYFALGTAKNLGQNKPEKVFVYDKNTLNQTVFMTGFSGKINAMEFDSSGKYLAVGEGIAKKLGKNIQFGKIGGNLSIYEIPSGKMIARISLGEEIERLSWEEGSKSVTAYLKGNIAKKLEIESGLQTAAIYKNLEPLTISEDGLYSMIRNSPNSVRLAHLKTGQTVNLMNIKDQWMIYHPEGYFDASEDSADWIQVSRGFSSYGLDQCLLILNQPDVLLERMGFGKKDAALYFSKLSLKRLASFGFKKSLPNEISIPELKVKNVLQKGESAFIDLMMSEKKTVLKSYQIWVNGVPLYSASGKKISGRMVLKKEKIELSSGHNRIEIACLNQSGGKSATVEKNLFYSGGAKGSLYFIGFGISGYSDPNLKLKYPAKDAKDLADFFAQMNHEGGEVFVKTFLEKEVTPSNLIQVKNFLKNVKVDDRVILFLSGYVFQNHYLPWQADLKNPMRGAIALDWIANLLQGTLSRKKLILLDGKTTGDLKRLEENPYLFGNHRLIQKDLYHWNGAMVFASSKPGDVFYESGLAENGFFALEIINALKNNRADKDGNKAVSLDEFYHWVAKNVSERSGNLQHPAVESKNRLCDFILPVMR